MTARTVVPTLAAPTTENQRSGRFSPSSSESRVSLQKGNGAREAPAVDMIDVMDDVRDFADTAAIVANLDLVISVDTSVAHLAGALGKPVFLLDRYDNCWRWLSGREDSPWYPSLRIFRQQHSGEWQPVIARVAAALGEMAERPVMARSAPTQ